MPLLKLIPSRNVKRRRRACASLNFDAPRYLHGEDGFLRDSEERRGASEDKDEEPEEDVHGHVGGAQVRGEPRKEERDEAADPLHDEHDDGGDAHPRVQAVNVGSNRIVRQKTIKSHILCSVLFERSLFCFGHTQIPSCYYYLLINSRTALSPILVFKVQS